MLNWRRDPDFERRLNALRIDRERIEKDIERIENEILQIEKDTEHLRQENARARALNALIRQRCFSPVSSSIPQPPTESVSRTF